MVSSHHTVSVIRQSPYGQCWPAITIQCWPAVTIQSVLASSHHTVLASNHHTVLASSHHTVSVGQQSPCSQCWPAITIQSMLASSHHTVSVSQQSPYPRVPCRPTFPGTERTLSPSSSCCPRPPSTRPTRCLGNTSLTAARCVYRAGSGQGECVCVGGGGGRGAKSTSEWL